MAIYQIEYITCDKCNPTALTDGDEGYFEGPENSALDAGWILTDEGHICPDCQDEEPAPPGGDEGEM